MFFRKKITGDRKVEIYLQLKDQLLITTAKISEILNSKRNRNLIAKKLKFEKVTADFEHMCPCRMFRVVYVSLRKANF
jgi:hypothetical protein